LGIARSNNSGKMVSTIIGTIPYMSPEVIDGKYTQSTDIWFVYNFLNLIIHCWYYVILKIKIKI
jgi:serine/threonine protein kinase